MPNPTSSISHEIATLRRSVKAMDGSLRRLEPMLRRAMQLAWKSKQEGVGRRKLNLSPKRLAQLKIQGKYMAYIRQLRPKQKVEVRSLLQKKGMPAAIARAQRLMSRIKAA